MHTILAAMLFVSSVGEADSLSLPIIRWSSDAEVPVNPTAIPIEDWSTNQDFALLAHGRDEYVIVDIRTLELRPFELWKVRLNHHRLGFRVLGYERRSGIWQELELRAAPLIGLVAAADDLQAFDFIGFKNDGSGPGVLTFQTSSVSSVVDDVELFSGLYQFLLGFLFLLCPSSVILGVLTRRWEFIWYFLFLLGAWLMAVDSVPGNPTLLSFLPDGASSLIHGFVLYGVGFMGLLQRAYVLARFPRFQKLARYSLYTLFG